MEIEGRYEAGGTESGKEGGKWDGDERRESSVDRFLLRSKVLANQGSRGICQAQIPGVPNGAEETLAVYLQSVWVVRGISVSDRGCT